MDSLLKRYQDEFLAQNIPQRTYESRKWFLDMVRAGELDATGKQLIRDSETTQRSRPRIGKMYTFEYSAKHQATLPYWDRYPLIILLDVVAVGDSKGFYGLNLHYLNSMQRAVLLDKLQKRLLIKNGDDLNENTKLKISYDILDSVKQFRSFRPTFKRYLIKHVKSRIAEIPAQYWEVSLFLPTYKFIGSDAKKVWMDSKLSIQKNK